MHDNVEIQRIVLQIGKRYGPFNLSAIPIGAYDPRWFQGYHHVDPAQAMKIHKETKSQKSFGIHWGTFSLTYEHYNEPRELIQELAKHEGQAFVTIGIGETIEG